MFRKDSILPIFLALIMSVFLALVPWNTAFAAPATEALGANYNYCTIEDLPHAELSGSEIYLVFHSTDKLHCDGSFPVVDLIDSAGLESQALQLLGQVSGMGSEESCGLELIEFQSRREIYLIPSENHAESFCRDSGIPVLSLIVGAGYGEQLQNYLQANSVMAS